MMKSQSLFKKTESILRKILLILTLTFSLLEYSIAQDSRAIDFNSGWKFHKGDGTGFDKTTFNDAEWRNLELPHDWSVEGPFSAEWASGTGYLPAGIGWYRKSFQITNDLAGKNVYLYFDGVYKNSEVWINDQYL
jgi:beta-galactosidase